MSKTKRVTISLPFGEGVASVTGYYTPGYAGCMYLRNGDPGFPPEPPEFELESIVVGGVDVTEEMQAVSKKEAYGYDQQDWLDWYIEKYWEKILEQCEESC